MLNLMSNAKFTVTDSTTVGLKALSIHADVKSEAQAAIKVAQAWLRSSGSKYKLVSFYRTTSQYSNLVTYYQARIVFKAAA